MSKLFERLFHYLDFEHSQFSIKSIFMSLNHPTGGDGQGGGTAFESSDPQLVQNQVCVIYEFIFMLKVISFIYIEAVNL